MPNLDLQPLASSSIPVTIFNQNVLQPLVLESAPPDGGDPAFTIPKG